MGRRYSRSGKFMPAGLVTVRAHVHLASPVSDDTVYVCMCREKLFTDPALCLWRDCHRSSACSCSCDTDSVSSCESHILLKILATLRLFIVKDLGFTHN